MTRSGGGVRTPSPWAKTARAPLVLSVVVREWGETVEALNDAFVGDRFGPTPVTPEEAARLTAPDPLADAPDHVRGDVPEWIAPHLAACFGDDWIAEAQALAGRPSLDLRVNTLKAGRDKVLRGLSRFLPESELRIAEGVRFAAGQSDSRTPNVQSEEGYLKGWFEVQDFGSQIVAALGGPRGGEQVLDLCAGAGGKTLAMAAAMQNRGQIFAYDSDRTRLAPIYDRLKRAGVRNVQVRPPGEGALDDLVGKLDRVVVDAPCTGSGTWRRQPTAKWKLTPEQLALRVEEQRTILEQAAIYLKPRRHAGLHHLLGAARRECPTGGSLPRRAHGVFRRGRQQTVDEPVRRHPAACPLLGRGRRGVDAAHHGHGRLLRYRDAEGAVTVAVQPKEMSSGLVLTAALVIAIGSATAMWFMIPDPQAQHRFASPSGRTALHVGEYCDDGECSRRIVAEFIAADGSSSRRGCAFELAGNEPLFSNVWPVWSADEQSAEVVYTGADGEGGKLALDFARDCTHTE